MNAAAFPKPLAGRGAFANRRQALEAAYRLAAHNAKTAGRPQTVGVVVLRSGFFALEGSRAAGLNVVRVVVRLTVEPERPRGSPRRSTSAPIDESRGRNPHPS